MMKNENAVFAMKKNNKGKSRTWHPVVEDKQAMKRFLILVLLLVLVYGCTRAVGEPVHVLAPEGFLPGHVLLDFENITGSQILVDEYDYGDSIEGALKQEYIKYDLVIVDEVFVASLAEKGLIARSETKSGNKFPGTKYLSGEILIGRNTRFCPNPVKSWKSLWDKKYAGYLGILWDPREMISIALLVSGYDMNSTDPSELKQAGKLLSELSNNVNLKFSGFNLEAIYSGKLLISITHSSALNVMKAYGSEVAADRPQEGCPASVLCLAFVKDMPHKDSTTRFYNYLLRDEIRKKISYYSGSSMEVDPELKIKILSPGIVKKIDKIYRENLGDVQ
ncbi:MAG: extracellular solute-binding protein [Candidatus Eremiobacteraeota bacterium]|nr:extracellular solute-binding protein [Candidatus Eremiobacteraeota bacterium]